jgi:hypothetical protein
LVTILRYGNTIPKPNNRSRMIKLICTGIITLGLLTGLKAQSGESRLVVGASNRNAQASNINAPRNIEASDGAYDKFVLIRWEPAENATQYMVFRSASAKAGSLQQISNAWQKSTWVSDYSALPNVDYYYTVVASNGQEKSAIGQFDKGFIKKSNAVAQEEHLLSSTEPYGEFRKIFMQIDSVTLDKSAYRSGDAVDIKVNMQNILEQQAPRTELRFFLSQDSKLDWNDRQLSHKSLSGIRPNAKFDLTERLQLPEGMLPGTYFLFTVSSQEGEILLSKKEMTVLKIVNP